MIDNTSNISDSIFSSKLRERDLTLEEKIDYCNKKLEEIDNDNHITLLNEELTKIELEYQRLKRIRDNQRNAISNK